MGTKVNGKCDKKEGGILITKKILISLYPLDLKRFFTII